MADGEDIGEDAVSQTTMEAALTSGPTPKKNLLPAILPFVGKLEEDDVLGKGKRAQGDVFSPSILEKCIHRVAEWNHIVDLICRRVAYLATQDGRNRGFHHQPKGMEYARKYAQKIENFIMKEENSSLDEILSKEEDLVFLRQLLEDILDSQESRLDAQKGGISPDLADAQKGGISPDPADAQKGGISPDPALAVFAAAPSCHRRGNADELFAPIPFQW